MLRIVNRIVAAVLSCVALAALACGGGPEATPTASPSLTLAPGTPTRLPAPTATLLPPATSTPTPQPETLEPHGFPIDPTTRLGVVVGQSPDRTLQWGGGPQALAYSRDDQVSDDAAVANRSGWDCRTHVEYEGQPAVDWYIPPGTPVLATMPGIAHLYVVTTSNAFDYYGVDREPYIGDPDRARAPLSPFPGPGGGKGIFVVVENDAFVTEYAHLGVETLRSLPVTAFLAGYGPGTDFASQFAAMRDYQTFTEVARWRVEAGDIIGLSGDTGYSEAPHLHYAVHRQESTQLLCPTNEAGFSGGGWLFGP